MKITGCETIAVTVDFEGVMSGTHVVLRLRTDEGLEGIAYVSRISRTSMRPMMLSIAAIADSLSGEAPPRIEAVHARLFKAPLGAPVSGLELRAASAIDVACWDLKGK